MTWQQVECANCGSREVEETYGVCECMDCGCSEIEKIDVTNTNGEERE